MLSKSTRPSGRGSKKSSISARWQKNSKLRVSRSPAKEWVPIFYKGEKLDTRRVDFIVEDVLVEIKAKAGLEEADFIQTLSYLKASGYKVALLLNFGAKHLQAKRLIYG